MAQLKQSASSGNGAITISGHELQTETRLFEQAELRFYPENPRIYSLVWRDNGRPNQEQIYNILRDTEHVRELILEIKENGGLVEPLIVKPETLEVLEGNSRLAAYRYLYSKDPLKWGLVRCTFLPANVSEATIFALLGKYHIKGKKDWAPYEQAGFLYRRYRKHKSNVEVLAREIQLKPARVKLLIDTFEFMINHSDSDVNHWSHYEELLKSRIIKKARDAHPDFDDMIVDRIKSGEIGAMQLRDELPKICEGPARILRKFVSQEITFEDAADDVETTGSTSGTYRRLNKFKNWIVKDDIQSAFETARAAERQKIRYELEKIEVRVRNLNRRFK